MTALRYPAEVRPTAPYFDDIRDVQLDAAHLSLAQELIANKTAPFHPAAFTDRYQATLLDRLKSKLNGTQPVQVAQAEASAVVDLTTALQKSLAQTAMAKSQLPTNGHGPLAGRVKRRPGLPRPKNQRRRHHLNGMRS